MGILREAQCGFCRQAFPTFEDLDAHIERMHTEEREEFREKEDERSSIRRYKEIHLR